MTSNLGAREMAALAAPGLGFAAASPVNGELQGKVERAGVEAARRRFSPEFMNRLDKVVVFRPLSDAELRRILDLELATLAGRWRFAATPRAPLSVEVSESAKAFLLDEGRDPRYGARHLKRAIERSLVHPVSSLLASDQVRGGDCIRVDFDPALNRLLFFKTAEAGDVAEAAEAPPPPPPAAAGAAAAASQPRTTRVRAK
jgi:ATP-dependent Clp protease ATP-binding subunit ClpA